jgi:hypothetical protein
MSNPSALLDYLERIPGYPFDPDVDPDFVEELQEDFPTIDILEQIKAFRWHHDGRPSHHFKSIRPAIRRWLSSAHRFDRQPF